MAVATSRKPTSAPGERFSQNGAAHGDRPEDFVAVMTPEQKRSRRLRSIAIACALAALVVLFYVRTMIAIGGNIAASHLN